MGTKLGTNIANYRKANKLTQEEFAARIADRQRDSIKGDYSKSVSKWELGDNFPEIRTLLLIAEELNLTLDELVNEAHEKFGISNELALGIEKMALEDLEILAELYSNSVAVKINNDIQLLSMLSIEKDKGVATDTYGFCLRAVSHVHITIKEENGPLVLLNTQMNDFFESLVQSAFVINYTGFKQEDEKNTRYSATLTLLNDYSAIKAVLDEISNRKKLSIKARIKKAQILV